MCVAFQTNTPVRNDKICVLKNAFRKIKCVLCSRVLALIGFDKYCFTLNGMILCSIWISWISWLSQSVNKKENTSKSVIFPHFLSSPSPSPLSWPKGLNKSENPQNTNFLDWDRLGLTHDFTICFFQMQLVGGNGEKNVQVGKVWTWQLWLLKKEKGFIR